MKFLSVFFTSYLIFTTAALAEPKMVYQSSNVQSPYVPIALIGLESIDKGIGCEDHFGYFIVDEVAYEGVSEIVGGIRVRQTNKDFLRYKNEHAPVLMRFNVTALSNADSSWVPTLVKKDSKLLIAYSVCGSGGFHLARDIYNAKYVPW